MKDKNRKTLPMLLLIGWGFICFSDILANCATYSVRRWFVIAFMAVGPFVIYAIVNYIASHKKEDKPVMPDTLSVYKEKPEPKENQNKLVLKPVLQLTSEFHPHPDLKGLIWFGEGPKKNYSPEQSEFNYGNISFSTLFTREHSAIYPSLPITVPYDRSTVPRPSYYPSYDNLSPEQRWMYLDFLADPYGQKAHHDIGYVFILYYGLERHLLLGKFDQAFDVIIKLRRVYDNSSFQSYSAVALMFSSIFRNRSDKFELFITDSMQLSLSLPFECILILHSIVHTGVTPRELMHLARSVGFTNHRYINMVPELFEQCLLNVFQSELGRKDLPIPEGITATTQCPVFANPSFLTKTVNIPDFTKDERFFSLAKDLLQKAHDEVKSIRAQSRRKKN